MRQDKATVACKAPGLEVCMCGNSYVMCKTSQVGNLWHGHKSGTRRTELRSLEPTDPE